MSSLLSSCLRLSTISWSVQRTIRRFYQPDQAARICHVQVLGTGSSEVGPSLCVSTSYGRYLFNCPELLQSALIGNQVTAESLRHIFVTKCSWDNIGGIPGVALVLKDSGSGFACPPITGPSDLKMFPTITRPFVNLEKGPINVNVATDGTTVLDSIDLKVTAVELTTPTGTTPTHIETINDNEYFKSDGDYYYSSHSTSNSIFAYIVQLATIRGKFDPEKAARLGLRPGRQYSQLVKGIPVTASNGNVVHPLQVMEPDQIGASLLVLECPTLDYVSSLVSHPLLQVPQFSPVLITHTTPRSVYETSKYQDWMNSYNKDVRHLLLHSDFSPSEMTTKSFNVQLPLHLVDSEIFRLPSFVSKNNKSNNLKTSSINNNSDDVSVRSSAVLIGQNSLMFHLRPLVKFGSVELPEIKNRNILISEALNELKDNTDFMKQLENHSIVKTNFDSISRQQQNSLSNNENIDNVNSPILSSESLTFSPSPCQVTFLGTGASCPSKIRGTSGILMHLPSGDYMLLDAGEGTMSQLYKCFGPLMADEIVRRLKCVFVSHIHGDHHLGLVRILRKREELLKFNDDYTSQPPLAVLGPWLLMNWLRNYSHYCERIDFDFTVTKRGIPLPLILQDTGLSHIDIVPVIHTRHSCGIVLYSGDQYKIVYSGDTRPCRELIQAGQGASLLIHETTFHHSLHEFAVTKRHTTDVEVLKVASQMGAEFLIVTHFSQRYTKAKSTGATMDMFGSLWANGAAVAFDFMSVKMSELEKLRNLNPIIRDVLTSLVINELEEDIIDCTY